MRLLFKVFFSWVIILSSLFSFDSEAMIQGVVVSESDSIGKAMVGLIIQGNGLLSYCSGTLVGNQTVLTAAHCFDDFTAYKVMVVFGTTPFRYASEATADAKKMGLKSEDEFFNHFSKMTRSVSPAKIYPTYQKGNNDPSTDFALVYLVDSVPADTKPIPIIDEQEAVKVTDNFTIISSGLDQFESGSPAPDKLLETKLKKSNFGVVVDTSEFVSKSSNKSWNTEILKIFGKNGLSKEFILIDEPNSEKLTKGDSGAAALLMTGDQPKVVGVVSQQYWDKNTLNVFGGVLVNLQTSAKQKWLGENIK